MEVARGPVARERSSCIYDDSKRAAGVCLGTIQARTHVQLALACQQSLLSVQHRLRLTMQHVYGHTGNLRNECADHAAALGSPGLVSHQNLATRWVRHNFDISASCGDCSNIGEVLENCAPSGLKCHRYLGKGGSGSLWLSRTHCLTCGWISASFFICSFYSASRYLEWASESPSSCVSTTSSSGESVVYDVWNPLMELIFHVQINCIFEPFVDEIDLAKIALSCHFALVLLCYKGIDRFYMTPHWAPLPV